ncbi:uncharacterized protein LOC132716559, partial [Ruditapes philippinarum]|uniref:uncharacterized protein LOC132716559 n=1 Tax=Ruditapes philippinarum TaxID=129788 RepID=UPI00295AE945
KVMAKSRAEIQRAYRERQKQKNKDEYLRQERDRKNRSYVPTAELSENDKKKRRQRNRNNLRKFYERKRQQRSRKSSQNSIGSFESANENNEPGPSSYRGRLRVRLDFGNRSEGKRKGAIKRWKRDMSDVFSIIRLLEQERKKLLTKVKTTQRNMQRMKQKLNKSKEKN